MRYITNQIRPDQQAGIEFTGGTFCSPARTTDRLHFRYLGGRQKGQTFSLSPSQFLGSTWVRGEGRQPLGAFIGLSGLV